MGGEETVALETGLQAHSSASDGPDTAFQTSEREEETHLSSVPLQAPYQASDVQGNKT